MITVGYVDTSVTVLESAGVAQLTVAISVPPQGDPIETSFFLLVNTNDGTAAGLSPCLELDLHTVSTSLPLTNYQCVKLRANSRSPVVTTNF